MLNLNCTEGPLSFFHTQIELPFYCIVYLIKETNVNWWQILSLHSLVSLCFSFFFPITLPFNLFIFVYETTNIVGLFLTRVFFKMRAFFTSMWQRVHRGPHRMVSGFTPAYSISVYHLIITFVELTNQIWCHLKYTTMIFSTTKIINVVCKRKYLCTASS